MFIKDCFTYGVYYFINVETINVEIINVETIFLNTLYEMKKCLL